MTSIAHVTTPAPEPDGNSGQFSQKADWLRYIKSHLKDLKTFDAAVRNQEVEIGFQVNAKNSNQRRVGQEQEDIAFYAAQMLPGASQEERYQFALDHLPPLTPEEQSLLWMALMSVKGDQ